MLTRNDLLFALKVLGRVLLALVNQGEWLGAWAGSINLLTGVVRIPAFSVDMSGSALGYSLWRTEAGMAGPLRVN